MPNYRWAMNLLAFWLLFAFAHAARSEPPAPPVIEIVSDSGEKFSLTKAELEKLPRKELTARDHRGDEAKFAGVLVADALRAAQVPLGDKLRGKELTSVVVVEAADKYRVAFSLPELDPEWTDKQVLIAVSRNGEPLDAQHGPFQIVAPSDRRHSRWVKNVIRLTVTNVSKPTQEGKP